MPVTQRARSTQPSTPRSTTHAPAHVTTHPGHAHAVEADDAEADAEIERGPQVDAFAHARRSPDVAVAFVKRFNAELGLSPKRARQKDEHMASAGQHFFTAMPALFYKDVRGPFASSSRLRSTPSPVGLIVGDAHLGNLGTRRGANGETVWGFSDCDKSGTGALEWDLDRLATHALLVAREAHKSLSADDERHIVDALASGYNDAMRAFANGGARPPGSLSRHDCSDADLADFIKSQSKASDKKAIKKRCPHGDFDKSERADAHEDAAVRSALADWSSRLSSDAGVALPIRVLATAKLAPDAGGSSAGISKYLALLAPAHKSDPAVLVRLKPVLPSAPDDGTGNLAHANAAKVVERATTLEGFGDPLLGFATVDGKSCLVEPERADEGIFDPTSLGRKQLARLAHDAGVALARAQLQSPSITRAVIRTWLGDPSTDADANARLLRFARDDADQTERDRKALASSL